MLERLSNYDWKCLFEAGRKLDDDEVTEPYEYKDDDKLKFYFDDEKMDYYADPADIRGYFAGFKKTYLERIVGQTQCIQVHVLRQMHYYHSLDWADIRENGYRFDPHVLYAIVEFREGRRPKVVWKGAKLND